MNPYSHLVIASRLEKQIKPDNLAEYYWGAVAPDVRYPAAMQRRQTHLPSQEIICLTTRHTHLHSFLQGYLVHCVTDEIELGRIFFRNPLFFILRGWMNRSRMAVIMELYYFEVEKVEGWVSANYNEVLSGMGVSEEVSTRFAQSINRYAHSSTPETRFTDLFQMLGLENDSRIEKYRSAAHNFQNRRWLQNILFFAIRTDRISEQIVRAVNAALGQLEGSRPTSPGK